MSFEEDHGEQRLESINEDNIFSKNLNKQTTDVSGIDLGGLGGHEKNEDFDEVEDEEFDYVNNNQEASPVDNVLGGR